jgi:hypothetical protein
MAALNALKGENDSLRSQLSDLRNQENTLRDQVNGLQKPLTAQQTTDIANNAANAAEQNALTEMDKRNQKFSLLGINVGPNFGGDRPGNASVQARGQYFSPFGATRTSAVQAQGEFIYNSGFATEGQFDLGLVHRMGPVQAGAFASFKYVDLQGYQQGGSLGEASFLVDYVFKGGRFGIFATQGFKNYAVLNNVQIYPGVYNQTYARIVNQYGANAMFGVWGDAYIEANASYLKGHIYGSTGGGELKLVQPITPHIAFTVEGDINETTISNATTGGVRVGLEVGNFVKPKEFADMTSPVPMSVPRIRYEIGTRRVGTAAPIADAGPNQLGIQPQVVTLDGSGSYDPLGEALTYSWTQVNGPTVTINSPTAAKATFTATYGNSYGFRLTVTNTDGLKGTATTLVTTVAAPAPTPPTIVSFVANPAAIAPGQSSTLSWIAQNVTSASINNGVGTVNATSGSVSVSPTTTTTYTLTETGPSGTVTQNVTVTVGAAPPPNPQILRFTASPFTIQPGQMSTLSWATSGATTVTISGLGSVALNGSTTVQPTATTTYTLTATSGNVSVSSPITVSVVPATVPQIMAFTAIPSVISAGQSSQICWQVTNATSISISNIGSNLGANACQSVTPSATTTYTLTATNPSGTTSGNVTVTVGLLQILSFNANPSFSPAYGGPVTLSWTTQGATSVVLIAGGLPPISNLSVNGSYTDHPTSDQTYTLTAYGPGGQTQSAVISVFVR